MGKKPRMWWWEVRMMVPVRVSMPRWLYARLKPSLVKRGIEIESAGVAAMREQEA